MPHAAENAAAIKPGGKIEKRHLIGIFRIER
jgi:hypothetical protein